MSAQCFTCKVNLNGHWVLTECGDTFKTTGRYLGIQDGYFFYSGNSYWVYSYCKGCFENQVLSCPLVTNKVQELTSQISILTQQLQQKGANPLVSENPTLIDPLKAFEDLQLKESKQLEQSSGSIRNQLSIDQKIEACLAKQQDIQKFMQLSFKQKDEDEVNTSQDIIITVNSKLNEMLYSLMIENGYKLQEQLKEMKIEAEKKVQTIEKLRSQFLENAKNLHSQQIISIDIIMMAFQNDIKAIQLDKITEYYNDISVMLIKYDRELK
eukprot:403371674